MGPLRINRMDARTRLSPLLLLGVALVASPAVAAPTADEAARLLIQASFGPSSAAIDDVRARGIEGWIDHQIGLEPSLHLEALELADTLYPAAQAQDNRQEVWWRLAVSARDQLRQRVAFALSEIFVVSDLDPQLAQRPQVLAGYYDVLVRNAFGNYRQLLEEITLSPAMGVYLSMIRNDKPNPQTGQRPDENFAREVMQLLSIGLWQLNLDGSPQRDGSGRTLPTYDQLTVENFARAFTGWGWGDGDSFSSHGSSPAPMKPYEGHHDREPKILLNGVQIPGGRTARQDLTAALDNLFTHPNVAPFITRRLIQRLVTSNPSPDYVRRVAAVFDNNGAGIRGDLRAVARAILLDAEARAQPASGSGKLREPLLRLTALWRAFGARAGNGRFEYPRPERDWSQAALRAPSVFNFFQPDYRAAGRIAEAGLYAPEFQIQTESTSVTMVNALTRFVRQQSGCNLVAPGGGQAATVNLDLCAAQAMNPEALITHLDTLLLAGRMSARLREVLRRHAAGTDDALTRARELIFLVALSPDFTVQK
jgi:uncharacterized protein (DUF1800 family)